MAIMGLDSGAEPLVASIKEYDPSEYDRVKARAKPDI